MSGLPEGYGPDPAAAARVLARALGKALDAVPEVVVVLGSGLGQLADAVDDPVVVPFAQLPGFPAPTVAGHAGRYVGGRLEGRPVLIQQGRYHLYEGHTPAVVALPVRTARALGVRRVIVTNAAGGIRPDLEPGAIVLIEDHLNLQGGSPLTGPTMDGETRFPDMSRAYDRGWMERAEAAAGALGVAVSRGVYAAVPGPSYETPAEIRMLERMGADLVGMSTVPEVIAARAGGLACLGVSLVTNRAARSTAAVLTHADVLEAGRAGGAVLSRLLREVLRDAPM